MKAPLHCAAFCAFSLWVGSLMAAHATPNDKPNEAAITSLRLAIADLAQSFPDKYSRGPEFLKRLEELEKANDPEAGQRFVALQKEALLANPLLDFDRLLLIKRGEGKLGLPMNWQSNSCLPKTGIDNELVVLSPVTPEGKLTSLYKPEPGRFVGDVDLDFDARRLLFSMPGKNGRWQIHELGVDGSGPREIATIPDNDVDNYDACYLPDGNLLFTSTAPFTGVPCVVGLSHVSNLFSLDAKSGKIRRLTFDQEHSWCPTVLNDGRVLYLRWEYSDIPHTFSRILFQMNPDGTEQREYYGSNSYWPNTMFYARPIPGSATKFVAVVGGHHDSPRMGELVLFDIAKGRHEAGGVVQRIPGRGKPVEPVLLDGLVKNSWPKFLHPWPLSDKYFIVSAKLTPQSKWGVYLADTFDNLVLLHEVDQYALLEPVPIKAHFRPPIMPDRVQPERKDGLVYISDIYTGPGLAGVPRGTVKKLRLFTYHFAYYGMGGQANRVGFDGPWDVKRVLGTVPVEKDGSALFRVPANTPISVQPLDAEDKAVQLMRSWMTAMPGETLSCTGCHDRLNSAPPSRHTIALKKAPSEIDPWYGPTRGFSFRREVQPVLDHYCIRCHNGEARPDGRAVADFRDGPEQPMGAPGKFYNQTRFPPSYLALKQFVRNATIESDMHLLTPGEFHADTTQLFQALNQGHYGVRLNREARDRLATWIDLNAPAHGTWQEIVGEAKVNPWRERRRDLLKRYANVEDDPEAIWHPEKPPVFPAFTPAKAGESAKPKTKPLAGWPFPAEEAKRLQTLAGPSERKLDLGNGVTLELVRIPAGEFVMGGLSGEPARRVKIAKAFWMGRCEVSNQQFAQFDPAHDSGIEVGDFLQFRTEERGWPVNGTSQPVVRVSFNDAAKFCQWLSKKSGLKIGLPTEAQWEYACRAGTATPLWFGAVDADFKAYANLADASFRKVDKYTPWGLPFDGIPPWRPAVETVDDGFHVSAPVGSFQPNVWGLCDMIGNAAEWTASDFSESKKVVRGGSWAERPKDATAASRLAYPAWQRVYNTGFRIICETP